MKNMWLLGAGVGLAATGAIAGAMAGGDAIWLHYIFKPLATLLIIGAALTARAADRRYRQLVLIGLCCSLVGDVLLMLPGDYFVGGLLAFLIAHLFYIGAMLPGARLGSGWLGLLALGTYSVVNLVGLWPHLQAELRAPVLAYVVVLALMAATALARYRQHRAGERRDGARWAAIGGLFFIASDSLLAWARFAGVVPMPDLLILVTYYVAQWCIARSISGSANTSR